MVNLKKLMKVILMIICFSLTVVNGRAAENVSYDTNIEFIHYIDDLFNGNQDYRVLKSTGEDYTSVFIEKFKSDFYEQNYLSIQNYFIENNLVIEDDQSPKKRNITNSVYKEYHTLKYFTDWRGLSITQWIDYSLSASATCDNKGNILSFSNAYISIVPSSFNWQMKNISCRTINKGTYINIVAKFTPVWDNVYEGAGISQYVASDVNVSLNWSPMY